MIERTIGDLEREMQGVLISNRPFSQELIRLLGEKPALEWYYHTSVQAFNNLTPHDYAISDGKKSKNRIAEEVYRTVTGEPN